MEKGLLVKKEGMTQIFLENGEVVPVTVLSSESCVVTQKKTEANDGYNAIQIGFQDKKETRTSKPAKGHFEKAGVTPKRYLKEVRIDNVDDYELGAEIKVDIFKEGEKVDVSGTTKGKGFQGVIKRHGQSTGPKTHGSHFHRSPGSMGASSDPSRVFKGKKLPGQMGNVTKTIENLEIMKVDTDRNALLVKGSMPGSNGSVLFIKK